jgi:dynein heavy chain
MFQIKVFKQFRMWKSFYVWRKCCSWRKFCIAQGALKQNLFILNPILQKALLSIQAMCCKLEEMSFTDVSKMEGNALSEFMEAQVCLFLNALDKGCLIHSLVKSLFNFIPVSSILLRINTNNYK